MTDDYKYESGNYFLFSMPYGQVLKVVRLSTFEIDEYDDDDNYTDIDSEAEIEGVIYIIRWNEEALPWHTKNLLGASLLAMGCQWGAQQVFNMRHEKK